MNDNEDLCQCGHSLALHHTPGSECVYREGWEFCRCSFFLRPGEEHPMAQFLRYLSAVPAPLSNLTDTKPPMKLTQHMPSGFDERFPRIVIDEWSGNPNEASYAKPWSESERFYRWSIDKQSEASGLLVAEMDRGLRWYVVGHFEGGMPRGLPTWRPPPTWQETNGEHVLQSGQLSVAVVESGDGNGHRGEIRWAHDSIGLFGGIPTLDVAKKLALEELRGLGREIERVLRIPQQ